MVTELGSLSGVCYLDRSLNRSLARCPGPQASEGPDSAACGQLVDTQILFCSSCAQLVASN